VGVWGRVEGEGVGMTFRRVYFFRGSFAGNGIAWCVTVGEGVRVAGIFDVPFDCY